MQNFKSFLDFSSVGQYLFQDSATPMMNGIVELHHYIMSFLIFVLIFVSGSLFTIIYMCVYLVRMFPKRPLKKIDRISFNSNWRPAYCVSLLRRRFLSKPRFVRFNYFAQVSEFTAMASSVQTMFKGYFKRYRIPVRRSFLSGLGCRMYHRVMIFDVLKKRGITQIRFATKIKESIRYMMFSRNSRYTWEFLLKFIESYSLGLFHYYRLFYTSRSYVHRFNHNTLLEVVWTTLPTVVLLFIGAPSFVLLYAMDEIIEPSVVIKCVGHQWYWSYEIDAPLKQAVNLCNPADNVPVDHDNIFTIGQILDFEVLTLISLDEIYKITHFLNTKYPCSAVGGFINEFKVSEMSGIPFFDTQEAEAFAKKCGAFSMLYPKTWDDVRYGPYIASDILTKEADIDLSLTPVYDRFLTPAKDRIRVAEFAVFTLLDKFEILAKMPALLFSVDINAFPFEQFSTEFGAYCAQSRWSKDVYHVFGLAVQLFLQEWDLNCFSFGINLDLDRHIEFEKSTPGFLFTREKNFVVENVFFGVISNEVKGVLLAYAHNILHSVEPATDRLGSILSEFHNHACKIDYVVSNIVEPNSHFYSKFDSYMISEENLDFGAPRLLEVDNALIIPLQTHIDLLISSSDVLHSWSVPSFGIKMDACPGRLNHANLFVEREGVFYGQCSELCGVEHGFMPIKVLAVPAAQFAVQLAQVI